MHIPWWTPFKVFLFIERESQMAPLNCSYSLCTSPVNSFHSHSSVCICSYQHYKNTPVAEHSMFSAPDSQGNAPERKWIAKWVIVFSVTQMASISCISESLIPEKQIPFEKTPAVRRWQFEQEQKWLAQPWTGGSKGSERIWNKGPAKKFPASYGDR